MKTITFLLPFAVGIATYLLIHSRFPAWEWLLWVACIAVLVPAAITELVHGHLTHGLIDGFFGLLSAWHLRRTWRRRKLRRAARLLGAKSRALRDALLRTMRRARKPSRVLRPHPAPS